MIQRKPILSAAQIQVWFLCLFLFFSPYCSDAAINTPQALESSTPETVASSEITHPNNFSIGMKLEGTASWYAGDFHGKLTANGEVFDTYAVSAAHKELPFGTRVLVTNLSNNKSVEVRINDRGPYVEGRIIDLSYAAAQSIDMVDQGIAPVLVEILFMPEIPESLYQRAGDSGWYRIQLGAFSDVSRAEGYAALLQENGFIPLLEETSQKLTRLSVRWIPASFLSTAQQDLANLGFPDQLLKAETVWKAFLHIKP